MRIPAFLPWLVFFCIVCGVVGLNKGYQTFFFRPCSAHQWRQSDGASYALNYYQNKVAFLPPQVHHRHAADGRAVSEFPVVYYLAAQGYSLFGFHDYFIRWIHFALFVMGLIFMIRTAKCYTSDPWLPLLPACLALTSPCLFYYAANFLPDVAAFSMGMCGFYFIIRFKQHKKMFSFLLATCFFTLAGLLKISGALLWVACMLSLTYGMYFSKRADDILSKKQRIIMLLIVAGSIAMLYGWIQYDKYVAVHYHFGGNLFGLLPIWDADGHEIAYILSRIRHLWMRAFLTREVWIALFISGMLILLYRKKRDVFLFRVLGWTAIGVLLYMICWFRTFDVHDYYLINLFCFPILLLYALLDLIEKKQWNRPSRIYAGILLCAGLLLTASAWASRREQLYRYFGKDYNSLNPAYYHIEPYLRSIGIRPDDWVVSVPDPSPNITLYLMNVRGFTECYTSDHYNVADFATLPEVKYLIVSDTAYMHQALYAPYCHPENQIGQFEGIHIFRFIKTPH